MAGYFVDIEKRSLENKHYREVLFTGPHSQLVVMSLGPGEDIGVETHVGADQFIRIEAGHGKAILDGEEHELHDGSAVVIASGTEHNIVNLSDNAPLQLYSVYSRPLHPQGAVQSGKAEASPELANERELQSGIV